jgi:hypothetical protein
MSIDPERPIEKLLRAYGKKRREDAGAPFKLHPVARRELQSEVSRRYGTTAPHPGSLAVFLARFWPRLALVSASAILVILIGGILFNRESRQSPAKMMASKDSVLRPEMVPQTEAPKAGESVPSRERALVPAPATPPLAATPSAAQAPKESQTSTAESSEVRKAESPPSNDRDLPRLESELAASPSSTPAAAPSMGLDAAQSIATAPAPAAPAPRRDVSNRVDATASQALEKTKDLADNPTSGNRPASSSNQLALNSNIQTGVLAQRSYGQLDSFPATNVIRYGPFAPMSGLQLAGRVADQTAFMRQQSVAPGTTNSAPAGPPGTASAVLASFRVEQSGRQLRVIDSDGSVYSGYVVAAGRGSARPRLVEDSSISNATASASAGLLTNSFAFYAAVPPREFSFRVSGTNLTLNQVVVFAGDLSGPSNAPALLADSAASAPSATESSPVRGGGFGGGGRGAMGGGGGAFGGGGAVGGGMGGGGGMAAGGGRGGGRGGRAGGRGGSGAPAAPTNQATVSAPAPTASPTPWPNIRIAGKVAIGSGAEADIEALAPAPPR